MIDQQVSKNPFKTETNSILKQPIQEKASTWMIFNRITSRLYQITVMFAAISFDKQPHHHIEMMSPSVEFPRITSTVSI